jgi:hypothetical protein
VAEVQNLPFNSLVGPRVLMLRGNGQAAGVEFHQTPADSTCLHLGAENTASSPYLAPETWNKTRTFICRQGLNGPTHGRSGRGRPRSDASPGKVACVRVSQRVGSARCRYAHIICVLLCNEWESRVG